MEKDLSIKNDWAWGEEMALCSECGFENTEDSVFCRKCGGTLQANDPGPPPDLEDEKEIRGIAPSETVRTDGKSKVGTIAVVLVVVVILIVAYLALTSKTISPLSSIRDSDGDGVPDSSDSAPNDASTWAWGHGTINVKITNAEWFATINYEIYIGTADVKAGTLDIGEYMACPFSQTFPVGQSDYHIYNVLVVIDGYLLGGTTTETKTVTLHNGGVVTAEFTSNQWMAS